MTGGAPIHTEALVVAHMAAGVHVAVGPLVSNMSIPDIQEEVADIGLYRMMMETCLWVEILGAETLGGVGVDSQGDCSLLIA